MCISFINVWLSNYMFLISMQIFENRLRYAWRSVRQAQYMLKLYLFSEKKLDPNFYCTLKGFNMNANFQGLP